jgi:hypothetical protein
LKPFGSGLLRVARMFVLSVEMIALLDPRKPSVPELPDVPDACRTDG